MPASARAHKSETNVSHARVAVRVIVTGRVQGVGFRPFCVTTARRLDLAGEVRNSSRGVEIELEGAPAAVDAFLNALRSTPPPAALIESITFEEIPPAGRSEFHAAPSAPGMPRVRVPVDLAICADCLGELTDRNNRRFGYPFITCTNCGPRYTILTGLPYDRERTTMTVFRMCPQCAAEYTGPLDRRFHSETNSCWLCGPELTYREPPLNRRGAVTGTEAVERAARRIENGGIVALKGLGGYQLLCRADDAVCVARLRQRKRRSAKPFAVMVPGPEWLRSRLRLASVAVQMLESRLNPIVIVEAEDVPGICAEVAPGLRWLGLFLPTTPVHVLLLRVLQRPVVATSGNVSDEPIVFDDADLARLAPIADGVLTHNRAIENPADDSVIRCGDSVRITVRVGRGLGPLCLSTIEKWLAETPGEIPPGVAVGGHQKVALAFWTGTQAILGVHIGDMDTLASRLAFERSLDRYTRLYNFEPAWFACDLHPDYFTAQWAERAGKPLYRIQHHFAHALSVMAELGEFERPSLVATWDGTGYGEDGTIWGGEILGCRVDGYERIATLVPFPLPGGEAAIREPWRIGLALLRRAFPEKPAEEIVHLCRSLMGVKEPEVRAVAELCDHPRLAPTTTSAGRLFDGVSALVLGARTASYEGEAAARLESMASRMGPSLTSMPFHIPLVKSNEPQPLWQLDWRPLVRELVTRPPADAAEQSCAAFRFHAALADALCRLVQASGERELFVSGGCFQNVLLLELLVQSCENGGITLRMHREVPPNDGGLAVGQLVYALGQLRSRSRLGT